MVVAMARSKYPRNKLLQAARLSALPGATIAEACKRYGVGKSALARVKKELHGARPSMDDVLLAALTDHGNDRSGTLPKSYASLASWMDYIDHDGCTPQVAEARVRSLAERGFIEIEGSRWTLRVTWPSDAEPAP